MVGRVRRAGREVGEERLVGHQRLLLAHPLDRVRRQIVIEVVALLRRPPWLHRRRALIERRIPLIGLATEEAVEVVEPHPGRPLPIRAHRARLPHRHLVALAELRRAVAIEVEDLRQRRGRVRPHRVVAGRGRRELGDVPHPHGVVVAAGEQRRPGRRAQRRRVKARVLQPLRREPLEVRRPARAAERTRGAEADVVDQHHQDVRGALRRPQRHDRRIRRVRVLGVIRRQPGRRDVGNRQRMPAMSLRRISHRNASRVASSARPSCPADG